MTTSFHRAALAALGLALCAACTTTKLDTRAALPPPLLEQLPVRVGVHYSKEFAEYVHRETRSKIDYEVTLGPAHVTNLDWLLKAMFREIVHVDDPTRVSSISPPVVFVLEPKFEEYSFLTPKDVAGEAFIVTIRYLLTLYDGQGARVDSFAFTGYGRERARTLASKEPLAVATQRAMRDAGAKVAVELADQESVRLLLRGAGSPLPVSPPAPPDQLKPPPAPFTPAQIPPTTDESSRKRWPVGQKETPPAGASPPATGTQPPATGTPSPQTPASGPPAPEEKPPAESSTAPPSQDPAGETPPETPPSDTDTDEPEESPPAEEPPPSGS
jgi:hypothetical protein